MVQTTSAKEGKLPLLIKIEGTRLLAPHNAHSIRRLNVTYEDKCYRTVAMYMRVFLVSSTSPW